MPAQIDCMRVLLKDLDERRRRGVVREGDGENYVARKFLGTLMRDFLHGAATRLPLREREATIARLLIAAPRCRLFLATRSLAACNCAIPIAAVTPTAQVKDLVAAGANNQTKRFHGRQTPTKNWTCPKAPCDGFPVSRGRFWQT